VPLLPVPRVLGVDDFALRRGHHYATILIDAITHRRVDVLPDQNAATLAAWLRDRRGVEVVCRDGSASYAAAITDALPEAVQVGDRRHLWHGLGAAVEKTVKRYARATDADQLVRPPRYRPCLVDPYRDHLRTRRTAGPVATTTLLAEIRTMGYTGSANLLVRYLNSGRADDELPDPSIRRLTSWIMTRPEHPTAQHRTLCDKLTATCPQMAALARCVATFANMITERYDDLQNWIGTVRAEDLPAVHSFIHGMDRDRAAVHAGPTLPYGNGPPKASTTRSNSSNDRPTTAQASPCSANASCSTDRRTKPHPSRS